MVETPYRLEYYHAMNGKTVVLLLIGGDKSTQHKDIEPAKAYGKRQTEE
jgi:putative addiction module killer protein